MPKLEELINELLEEVNFIEKHYTPDEAQDYALELEHFCERNNIALYHDEDGYFTL